MRRMIVGYFLFVPALFAQMTMPMPADQKPAAMPECAAMMQKENAMQQHMADMNAKLQTLVDDMNKAKGSARIEKMEAVINELVTQRAMVADAMSCCPMMQRSSPTAPPGAEPKH